VARDKNWYLILFGCVFNQSTTMARILTVKTQPDHSSGSVQPYAHKREFLSGWQVDLSSV